MFASLGEVNQFTGLVARSPSTFARVEVSPAAAAPVTLPLSDTGGHSPALHVDEAHPRSAHPSLGRPMQDPVAREADQPAMVGQSVDTTSVLLLYLSQLINAATSAKEEAHINKHQCALAVRRLRLIAATLRQMPRPAPSPPLLTAMQSLCLLLRQCAHGSVLGPRKEESPTAPPFLYGPDGDPLGPAQCWPVLLCQHFTSRLLFKGAYQRLWAAWSMYSPVELEREDSVAESLDCTENAQVMMELLFPMLLPSKQADHPASTESGTVSRHMRDMLVYYQRRQMSPWRILYEDLKPTEQLVPGLGQRRSASTPVSAAAKQNGDDEESVCFRVAPHVYQHNGVPVVVKALCGAAGTDEREVQEVAMQHAAEFVLDAGYRVMWCHPHIVTCLGCYTERFVDDEESSNVRVVHGEDHGAATEERAASAAVSNLPWKRAVSTATGKPIIALGYVMELQSAPWLPASANSTQASFVTLHDLLFSPPSASLPTMGRHHFTLHEALGICAQIASALQYIMADSHEVSEAVRTAWLTVDPANIFVLRVVELNGEEKSTHPPQKQQQSDGSGGQHAAETTLPLSGSNESAVFTASIASFAEGGSPAEAPVVSHLGLQGGHGSALEGALGDVDPSLRNLAGTTHAPSDLKAEVHINRGRNHAHGSAEDTQLPRSKHFVVRYNPPCKWTPHEVAGSRWRPHARAAAPASYVVVQLFLALLTGQVPYAHISTNREVEERVFAGAKHHPDSAADLASRRSEGLSGAQVKPSGSGQGYRIPPSLPPMVANWCRRALSLDRSQPPMKLEELRDSLTMAQASLPDCVCHSQLSADDTVEWDGTAVGGRISVYEEMQSRANVVNVDALC
ncbi:hypothetical protein LSCM1_05307 [Leishmania martiniquensis]|uniref:Protein kinase domain-containing protein n=1 Tax=Leishmania martiniquensis TaxID=1580590 RepID=A0A836H8M3_9TRYP|nr:hypothetical protein LSCM1_05307 [Leishmania martiniquensis]